MRLDKIEFSGYKSYDSGCHQLSFGDATVLLGANGAGKSNLVSLFKLIAYGMSGSLQEYLLKNDANSILHYGSQCTENFNFSFFFSDYSKQDEYHVTLSFAKPERLFVSSEKIVYSKLGESVPLEKKLKGDFELALPKESDVTSRTISALLKKISVYQFHDTSETARIKRRGYVDDSAYLRSDAGNLAAFLLRLKESEQYKKYYDRIVSKVQRAVPQFKDFILNRMGDADNYVRLNWLEKNNGDYLFGPHQLSDGSIRFMALTTLLLQPPELMPSVIIIDEPELGLHPQAISELASMIKLASRTSQVVIATQSPKLVDEFSVKDIAVVEKDDARDSSVIKRLNADELQQWIEEYSLSDLWEKNVLGGQP